MFAALDKEEALLLSPEEVAGLIPPHARAMVNYVQLELLSVRPTLEELFAGKRNALLFINLARRGDEKLGHWTALVRPRGASGDIEFFDPYGHGMRKIADLAGLTDGKLTYISVRYKVRSPLHPVQHRKSALGTKIDTCGRHCAVRLSWPNLDQRAFYTGIFRLNRGVSSDMLVTAMTHSAVQSMLEARTREKDAGEE